ncbi:MAG: lysine 2,3-aminomutase, partial [Candidatus Electrothrix sp. AUS1_2]|nr:lysine 2,3-aminomutase [Candidatus Electrothrix sp. AUS1_2]
MTSWQDQLKHAVTTPEQLAQILPCNQSEITEVTARYPLRISPYYLNL